MESDRHAFMRKLLQLCVDTNVDLFANGEAQDEVNIYKDGVAWIVGLTINRGAKTAAGYWDGERHEVRYFLRNRQQL